MYWIQSHAVIVWLLFVPFSELWRRLWHWDKSNVKFYKTKKVSLISRRLFILFVLSLSLSLTPSSFFFFFDEIWILQRNREPRSKIKARSNIATLLRRCRISWARIKLDWLFSRSIPESSLMTGYTISLMMMINRSKWRKK